MRVSIQSSGPRRTATRLGPDAADQECSKRYFAISGGVLATLVGILGDIELAEDAAQEAFALAAGSRC
jgi:hypothetical protein